MQCRVCHNVENNQGYRIREMMHGTQELFDYFQCAYCQCLQIAEFPADMAPYYPSNYIGFNAYNPQYTAKLGVPLWANTMDFCLIKDVLHHPPGAFGGRRQVAWMLAERAVAHYLPGFKDKRQARILDVGCGSGEFLGDLRDIGFTEVLGVDLYIEQALEYDNGVRVIKGTIDEIEPRWDVIMFHHSFEHIPNPLETLQTVSTLLSPQGLCLIRQPVIPSYAWEKYGVDWMQIDAPRHFFLHSGRSMSFLAKQSGLRLAKMLYDSNITQFCGSEQYQQDIPLFCERSYLVDPANSIFSEAEIALFWQKTRELNATGQGDQAAFYLTKRGVIPCPPSKPPRSTFLKA